jgi:hypothetical protein
VAVLLFVVGATMIYADGPALQHLAAFSGSPASSRFR